MVEEVKLSIPSLEAS